MNRLSSAWFEFKGKSSADLGIMMAKMPQRGLPPRNVTRKKVAGRDGRIRKTDESFDDVSIKLEFDARDETKLLTINALLTGSGPLRFSDEPDYVYDACIEAAPTRQSIRPRFGGQRYTVTFVCAPFRTLYEPAEDIVLTESGTRITNPGTADALPRIKVKGSGSFSLTIGSKTMFFEKVKTGVIIDTELGDVLNYSGSALANDKVVNSDLLTIPPGRQMVRWLAGGTDDDGSAVAGSVETVTITPRWRYI